MGDSGAGKSTITKLLMRLYDPTHGAVLVDGRDLKTINTKSLHDQISIVPQNPDLFNMSIEDNIACVLPATKGSESSYFPLCLVQWF